MRSAATFQTRTGKLANATTDCLVMVHICSAVWTTPPLRCSMVGDTPKNPASMLRDGSSLSGTKFSTVLTSGSVTSAPARSTTTTAAPSPLARMRSPICSHPVSSTPLKEISSSPG